MKILITGANGFLGNYLTRLLLLNKHHVIATGKGESRLNITHANFIYHSLDFTDKNETQRIFNLEQPNAVVHAGAISKPDECEINQSLAYNINVIGTENILHAALETNCFLIYVSTDFVFKGDRGMYNENDKPNPANYYGQTKLLAEQLVERYPSDWSIVRTILVYGKPLTGKKNILTIVKEKLENGESYSVVNDQVRTPTYVEDLAQGIATIIERKATGIFHLSGEEAMTPYEMACRTADFLKLDKSLLKKVSADSFKEIATRPLKTGFIIDKAKEQLNYRPISFEEGLKKTFE